MYLGTVAIIRMIMIQTHTTTNPEDEAVAAEVAAVDIAQVLRGDASVDGKMAAAVAAAAAAVGVKTIITATAVAAAAAAAGA